MLSKGVHLLEALHLAEEMLLGLLHKRIAHLRKAVDAGKSLREAYSMVPIFSPMFVKNIALGESSGHLSSSFARIGRQNQESLKKIMDWANTLIEPVLITLIALVYLDFSYRYTFPCSKCLSAIESKGRSSPE